MKKITLNLVKGLLAIVLFTGVSVVLSTTGVQTMNTAKAGTGYGGSGAAAGSGQASQINTGNVSQYLVSHGYSNVQNISIATNTTWTATAINTNGIQVSVTLYIQGCQIVASNDGAL